MKNTKKLLLAALAAAAICTGTTAIVGCSSNKSGSGTFTIDSVSGLAETYALDDVINANLIKFNCTDENGDTVVINYSDVTIESDGDYSLLYTGAEGTYTFTATYNGVTYTFSYTVSSITLTLDFNGGTYNEKTSQEITCGASGADISDIASENIVAAEGYVFAGWFYDMEGTQRVTVTDNVIDVDADTTLYACYDKDWSDYYEYTIADGCVTLSAADYKTFYKNASETSYDDVMIIPATIELYPVTAIGDNFANVGYNNMCFETYTTLTFEEGSKVESIGEAAFTSLYFTTMTFPESLKKIGNGAFSNCSNLTGTLTLSKNIVSVGDQAFSSTDITAVDFEAGCSLTEIGEEAFMYCDKLIYVNFPDKLTTIGASVFEYCSNITTLHIPASVTNIALGAFSSMGKLKDITVDSGNANYTVAGGDLYRKEGENLSLYRYCYGYERETYDPSTIGGVNVTSIGKGAFSLDTDSAKNVKLENIYLIGVTSVNESAFKNCAAQVWLSDSVTTVSSGAFSGYDGTEIKLCDEYRNEKQLTSTFSVDDDGVLYNADKTELVCILENYGKRTYTLPNTVKTVRTGAIIYNNNIYIIKIGANSALEKIQSEGIQIGSMNSLRGIYCYKETPFTLADNAFDSEWSFGSPYVYVKDSAYSAYAESWKNYVGFEGYYGSFGTEEDTKLGVSDILSTASRRAQEVAEKIAASGYTSYSLFKKGVSGITTYAYEDNTMTYLEAFREALSVCVMLDTTNEYAKYLYSYAADFIKLAQCIYEYSYSSYYYVNDVILLWNEYTDETINAAANLSAYIEKAKDFENNTSSNSSEITALNKYFGEYTYNAASFSAADFDPYYTRMHSSEVIDLDINMYYGLDDEVAQNYMKGEASYLITKLKALYEAGLTADNYMEAYALVYGDGSSSEGIYGLIYNLYFDWDTYSVVCSDTMIAGYSDYLTIKDELYGDAYTAFIAKMVDYIDKFEITSTYDETKYEEFITNFYLMDDNGMSYSWMSALGEKSLCAKYYAILSSWNIHDFLENYLSYSEELKDSESKTIYNDIVHSSNIAYYDATATDETTYESWIVDLDKFTTIYTELQKGYDDAVTELKAKLDSLLTDGEFDFTKLTAETYAEIVALEEEAQPHIDELIMEEATSDWGYTYYTYTEYYTYLAEIDLWNELNNLTTTYPTPSEVTDLDGLYKLLYSYYDMENGEYVYGLDNYYNAGLTYGYETYEKYTALFSDGETGSETDGNTTTYNIF